MSKWFLVAGLALLNLVLVAGVYYRLMERPASAQIGGGHAADLASVAGINNGQTILYIMDSNTGMLHALRVDVTNRRVEPVAQANISQDLQRLR